MIAFAGLLIAWFAFTMLIESRVLMSKSIQMITYFFLLFTVGAFYSNQYYRELASRSKGINFLLVPASTFEKVLCSLLFTVILFFIIFTSVFYLVDVLMVAVAKGFTTTDFPDKERGVLNVFEAARVPFDVKSSFNILLIFFSIQSIFLLGSVYFTKFSFIKTIITGFVIFFVVFFFVYFLNDMMPKGEYAGFLTSYRIYGNGKEQYIVSVPRWLGQFLDYLLMYGFAPFMWIVTYFRLKEKQV
jgi:hypothetical protein